MSNNKPYFLEERTVKSLEKTIANIEDVKQLIRSSGSVGANYIEANEALGKKDFAFKAKISRKGAKESAYLLRLIMETNDLPNKEEFENAYQESNELKKILSAINDKSI